MSYNEEIRNINNQSNKKENEMKTRRERLEAKLEKRQEWAEKATSKAQNAYNATRELAASIPPGQPILVGHHSEKHARRDADRIDAGMRKTYELKKLADHHKSKAAGLTAQLKSTIFSDDHDAQESLQARIAEREAEAEKMIAVNKAWRKSKGNVETFAELAEISIKSAQKVADTIAKAFAWEQQPYPSSKLSNLRASIRADKERLKCLEMRQVRTQKAEQQSGGVFIEGTDYIRVTFAEKPNREVLNSLKAAGFRWSGNYWYGQRANLPESVAA